MSITEKSGFQQSRRNWNSRRRAWHTDRYNRKVYGKNAPLFAERIWVPVEKIQYAVKAGSSKQSGQVIHHWLTRGLMRVDQTVAVRACIDHWQYGVDWKDTGIYEVMVEQIQTRGKVDRLRTLADIKLRYQQLDTLYSNIQKTRRLSTRQELISGNFREEGGVLINIGPDGTPYFGKKGHHRLAIALALRFEYICAQLGMIHVSAIDHLESLRQAPERFS